MPSKKELYKLTKEMLFAKFDGLCAFCGHGLGEKWHIWEMEPGKTIINAHGQIILGDESYDNKLPSCISCNSTRVRGSQMMNWAKDSGRKLNIEQFRQFLYHEYDFLKNYSMGSTYFKKALRYGLIKETGNPIIFHFEKFPQS